jgi:CRISPR-associated protein Cas2
MQGAHWWLVCYDVRDPERLRKAAKHLEGYGERMQYSVFRCWLTRPEKERLRWELTELLAPEDDVLLIPVCGSCAAGICGAHAAADQTSWPRAPARHQVV